MLEHNSNKLLAVLLACCSVVGCMTQPDAQKAGEALAFVSVTVVPMDSERVMADQTVIVRDGRIDEIGPASQAHVPENAVVIDGRGRYLMPGLADMHVHLESEDPASLAVFLANGVTTVRCMWGNPEILQWRRDVESGELLGPTIYTTGPILDGDPPYWPGSTVITTPEQAVREVAAEKQAGYDAVKVLDNLLPDVYEAVLRAAREQGLPVYGHVPWRVGLEDALGGGQKSFEHITDWMHALLPDDSPVRRTLLEIQAGKQPMTFQTYMVQPFKNADVGGFPDSWRAPLLRACGFVQRLSWTGSSPAPRTSSRRCDVST